MTLESRIVLTRHQEHRFLHPDQEIEEDIRQIYTRNKYSVGLPEKYEGKYAGIARKNTLAVVGVALGDEGKGRIVDNSIESILADPAIAQVYVIRYQGGSNAGHTVESDKGLKLALHQIPSSVMYPQAIGVMDRGMAIHVEDLKTEVGYVEKAVGSMKGRLFLSRDALHVTDLERAKEFLNNQLSGKSKGGTGRGIAPTYASHLDRTGTQIKDLLDENWEATFGRIYDLYQKVFDAHGYLLEDIKVPNFRKIVTSGKSQDRSVGTKAIFLERLANVRTWLMKQDMACNTSAIHRAIFTDPAIGIVFEGSQAAGLDPWLGTMPDTTSSNTRVTGISEGTAFWKRQNIAEAVGIMKVPYTSSVGDRHMPTEIADADKGEELTADQRWAERVREEAHEYGTTTGRPRDINFLDFGFLTYNAYMSDIDSIAVTHLDIAHEDDVIKVCTHYTDENGTFVPYQPGLDYQKDVVPHYVQLPGWDGEACQKARSLSELPENAIKFLAFVQKRIGLPIVAATTGPGRQHFISFAA